MNKRQYNIFFDLHTVSGIVISVLLYVIFFAGSFSFFRDNIVNWERNETVIGYDELNIDLDKAFQVINDSIPLQGRDIALNKHHAESRFSFNISPSKDTLLENASQRYFFYLDENTFKTYTYDESYTLGEFLYRLHFFAQIPYPYGYYLAGLIGLFLAFAVLTGLLIHWDKIVSHFYVFRPYKKLKTVWTDAHTALGTIGIPFQFLYGITGAFLLIKTFILVPTLFFFYNGDDKKLYEDIGFAEPHYDYAFEKVEIPSIDQLVAQTADEWEDFHVNHMHVYNYGDANMHFKIEGEPIPEKDLVGFGHISYDAQGKVLEKQDPYAPTDYGQSVLALMYKIHYGEYGGYLLKIASFLMGLLSCFVVITGVLIWLKARDNKKVSEKKRKYNKHVSYSYLAICLSMLPITALSFIYIKLFPGTSLSNEPKVSIYSFYFLSWLVLSLFLWWKQDNYFTNKFCLLSGGILGLLVPIVNGLVTGNWFWFTWQEAYFDLFVVDLLWIGLSSAALFAYYKILQNEKRKMPSIG